MGKDRNVKITLIRHGETEWNHKEKHQGVLNSDLIELGIGIFAGKLDYTKLKFPLMMFVMLIIGAKPGDKRNWHTITAWADSLKEIL